MEALCRKNNARSRALKKFQKPETADLPAGAKGYGSSACSVQRTAIISASLTWPISMPRAGT